MSEPVLTFDHVALRVSMQQRRGGGSRKQRLRRLAGESKRVTVDVLTDVSLSLAPGDSVALITREKRLRVVTTRLASGSLLPDSGSVTRTVDVVAIRALSRVTRRRMTVRQNIYLMGGLLGLSPEMITASLDRIVDLARVKAGLDKYLYTVGKSVGPRLANATMVVAAPGLVAVEQSLFSGGNAEHTLELLDGMRESGTAFLLCVEDFTQARSFCDAAFLIEDGASSQLMSVPEAIARVRASEDDEFDEELFDEEDDDDDDSSF